MPIIYHAFLETQDSVYICKNIFLLLYMRRLRCPPGPRKVLHTSQYGNEKMFNFSILRSTIASLVMWSKYYLKFSLLLLQISLCLLVRGTRKHWRLLVEKREREEETTRQNCRNSKFSNISLFWKRCCVVFGLAVNAESGGWCYQLPQQLP